MPIRSIQIAACSNFLEFFNELLVPRLYAAGGKVYPPFAPTLSRDEWREHYGTETWRQFADAKRRFDPANVLNPGRRNLLRPGRCRLLNRPRFTEVTSNKAIELTALCAAAHSLR